MEYSNIYFEKAVELAMGYGTKLVLAILVLVGGLWLISWINRVALNSMERSNVEQSLQKFLSRILSISLKILLLISVASMVGIATTSFIAVLGAAGLAVGLALQGSLANFAGGVLILLFKPYKVGDVIEAQGFLGTVNEIQVFYTVLKSFDNKTIVIPNGSLSNGSITNYSTEKLRRADMTFGIGYDDDIEKARNIIKKLIEEDERILKDPAPSVVVSELAGSSVNFSVKVWCNSEDLWNVYFDMQERVKISFDNEGITIPYPQSDVHIYQHSTNS